MKDHPLISIVVLNYNGLHFLEKTIPLILQLSYSNYEIIVIDNNSSDGSIEYLEKYKRIQLVKNKENFGYSTGKNIGVENAQGTYVLLLDNDIVINNYDIIEVILESKPGDKILSLLMENEGETSTQFYGGYLGRRDINIGNKNLPTDCIVKYTGDILCSFPFGGAMFFKKSVWDKVGGFDESQPFNMDDGDIGPRAWIYGFSCVLFNKIKLTHIGISTRTDLQNWLWRYKYFFSGQSTIMFKNYKINNLLSRYPIFFILSLMKTVKQTVVKKNFDVMKSYIWSILFFIKNLPDILKKRKEIQQKRVSERDVFLTFRPPNFKEE